MTISNTVRTAGPFIGDGVVTSFPFAYKVFARSDVLVARTVTATSVETVLVLDADYVVSLNADQNATPGGTIVLLAPLATGTTLAATSNIPITQSLDLTNNGGFYPTAINGALDRIVIQIQQLAAKVGLGSLNVGAAALIASVKASFDSLANSSGASKIGYMLTADGSVLQKLSDILSETINESRFGVVRDGNTDDYLALQKAVTFANNTKKILQMNVGRAEVSDTILVGEFLQLRGNGMHFTSISGTKFGLTAKPVVANVASAFIGFLEWKDFAIIGGSQNLAFNVTSEMAYCNFSNILFRDPVLDNFYVNKLMQSSNWTHCKFSGGNRGVVCANFTANMNNFNYCEFNNHVYEDVYFNNGEVNNFNGCEFGNAPATVNASGIVLNFARNTNFNGCYFENGHPRLLTETNSDDSTKFDGCHFTGAIDGSQQFTFVSLKADGTTPGLVQFGSNSWYLPSDGAARMLITGHNQGKLGSPAAKIDIVNTKNKHELVSPSKTYPAGAKLDLLNFACTPADNAATTLGLLTGWLTLHYTSLDAGGVGLVNISRTYQVNVTSVAGLTLGATLTLDTTNDALNGSTFTPSVKAGATAQSLTIEGTFTGHATPAGSLLGWSLNSTSHANANTTYITPSIA